MIKKIIILFILIISIFSFQDIINAASTCNYVPSSNIKTSLEGCGFGEKLVEPGNVQIGSGGFKVSALVWIKNIAGFLGLISVGALVYAAFMMTISGGEEEKIKKAKDIIKWTILGFLGVVVAGSLITIIVKFMYSF